MLLLFVCARDDRRRDTRMCLIARVFPGSEREASVVNKRPVSTTTHQVNELEKHLHKELE